ncbi:hypothetical protein HanPI659440_Chr13g0515981 [Helianthus annuus]|nr:hypothetical protein HanPI659440_Chr13g0515981 [Helianthus annuus]
MPCYYGSIPIPSTSKLHEPNPYHTRLKIVPNLQGKRPSKRQTDKGFPTNVGHSNI